MRGRASCHHKARFLREPPFCLAVSTLWSEPASQLSEADFLDPVSFRLCSVEPGCQSRPRYHPLQSKQLCFVNEIYLH